MTTAPCPPLTHNHQGFENRRHLLRLHLSHKEARPLDPEVFGPGQPGNRLGVYTGARVCRW